MLTGRRPLHRGAAAPSMSNRHFTPELDDIVLKAVAPNPDRRYQSAATLAAELRSIGAILDVRGGADDEIEQAEPDKVHVGRAVLAAVILLVLGTLVWLMLT
jgi:hypothetical protein